jgi:hypothetical protein
VLNKILLRAFDFGNLYVGIEMLEIMYAESQSKYLSPSKNLQDSTIILNFKTLDSHIMNRYNLHVHKGTSFGGLLPLML